MQITNSLDWDKVSWNLKSIGSKAHNDPKFAKVLTNVGCMVRELSNMEVEARRTKKLPSKYRELLAQINEEIENLEMLIMLAALAK
jgi:hypothetical protein